MFYNKLKIFFFSQANDFAQAMTCIRLPFIKKRRLLQVKIENAKTKSWNGNFVKKKKIQEETIALQVAAQDQIKISGSDIIYLDLSLIPTVRLYKLLICQTKIYNLFKITIVVYFFIRLLDLLSPTQLFFG